jgi:hypothetical protein
VRPEIANAQWPDDKVIIVTKWIDDLKPSFIPPEFRGEDKTLFPSSVLGQKSKDTVCELLQWSERRFKIIYPFCHDDHFIVRPLSIGYFWTH